MIYAIVAPTKAIRAKLRWCAELKGKEDVRFVNSAAAVRDLDSKMVTLVIPKSDQIAQLGLTAVQIDRYQRIVGLLHEMYRNLPDRCHVMRVGGSRSEDNAPK